ncbi:hypothetical protein P4480_30660, partial [Bacillus thuringiensis]
FATPSIDNIVENSSDGSITLTSPDTVTLAPGIYQIHYIHSGNPVNDPETIAIELLLNSTPVPGSYIWAADLTTQEGTINPLNSYLVSNKINLEITTSSSLQIRNKTNGLGSNVLPGPSSFLSGKNLVRTSLTIVKLG